MMGAGGWRVAESWVNNTEDGTDVESFCPRTRAREKFHRSGWRCTQNFSSQQTKLVMASRQPPSPRTQLPSQHSQHPSQQQTQLSDSHFSRYLDSLRAAESLSQLPGQGDTLNLGTLEISFASSADSHSRALHNHTNNFSTSSDPLAHHALPSFHADDDDADILANTSGISHPDSFNASFTTAPLLDPRSPFTPHHTSSSSSRAPFSAPAPVSPSPISPINPRAQTVTFASPPTTSVRPVMSFSPSSASQSASASAPGSYPFAFTSASTPPPTTHTHTLPTTSSSSSLPLNSPSAFSNRLRALRPDDTSSEDGDGDSYILMGGGGGGGGGAQPGAQGGFASSPFTSSPFTTATGSGSGQAPPGSVGVPSVAADGTGLKQREKLMDDLKKENFALKLKIYYLEQQLERDSPEGVAELVKENGSLKAANSALDSELRALQAQLAALRRELESRDAQIARLEQLSARYATEYDSALENRGRASDEAERLRQDHARIAAEAERIARALRERDGECDVLKLEVGEMRRRCAELERALAAAPGDGEARMAALAAARADALARAEAAERALAEAKRSFEAEIGEMRDALERARKESLAARTESVEAKDEARKARAELEMARDAEAEARRDAERERARAREAERARGEAEGRVERERGEVGGKEDHIAKLQATITALTSSLNTSTAKASDLDDELRRVRGEVERARRDTDEQRERARTAEGAREKAEADGAREKAARERAESEAEAARRGREGLEQSLKSLQSAHDATLSTLSSLQSQVSQLSSDLASTTAQLAHAQSQLARRASAADRTQMESLVAHEAELDAIRAEVDARDLRVVELTRVVEVAKKRAEEESRQRRELEKELDAARKRMEERGEKGAEKVLREQLSDLKTQLDAHSSVMRKLQSENADLRSKLDASRRSSAQSASRLPQPPKIPEVAGSSRDRISGSRSMVGSLEAVATRGADIEDLEYEGADDEGRRPSKAKSVDDLLVEGYLDENFNSIHKQLTNLIASQQLRAEEAQQLQKEIDSSKAATQSALRGIQDRYGAEVRDLISELREAVVRSRNEVVELNRKLDKSHGIWHEAELRRREAEDDRDVVKEKYDRTVAEWSAKYARLVGKLEVVEDNLRSRDNENQALRSKLNALPAPPRMPLASGGSSRASGSGRNIAGSNEEMGTRGVDFDDDIPDPEGADDGDDYKREGGWEVGGS
ncbi:hypothetical protein M427DRAFT_210867 [Gonapodya prolifera JEL478]|uniref:Centrosomin N-terminal motif 1 domain-containing protein n=1 Tax=Gonapodya prolifera (strain JEL478) TaxID=1344416 RepID=A0A139APL5_GONPJ|nr:hypothetical protein M427DRAFT_210867 [Gonapodya prolifera JEL478]|eukprot:KXS18453.1 hypothetical protein M427DRAFT_210867 [Gonapodya prolifera JEL478]